MIELLILYEISKKVLTMYGISKEIKADFSVFTTPSYGTIKPALIRLEKLCCVRSQKHMSSGGRPSVYYSITEKGEEMFSNLILEKPQENPIHFLTFSRIKLSCVELLDVAKQKDLYKILKHKATEISLDIKHKLESGNLDFYQKIVFDNLLCEYNNFISLLEGLERASKN